MSSTSIHQAAAVIAEATGRSSHSVGLVLGSGLSSYAETIPGAIAIPYAEIPGFPVPRVEGHSGTAVSAEVAGANVLILAGRSHLYEDYPMNDIVFGVRVAVTTGCQRMILTNAAGGCGHSLEPGDLTLISDHLNLTGRNPLFGPNELGPRFPDMTDAYDPGLRSMAREVATRLGIELKEGVYAWFTGPSYETPAEVEMAKRMGADLVGMSTVPETIAIRHMGARVLGISLVTNLAAGISPTPLSHEEVQEIAQATHSRLTQFLNDLLAYLAEASVR